MENIKIKYVFILFVMVAVAQLFVPAQMIFGQEAILNTGKAYKFKTRPVDPSDPYRGKYITLSYDMRSVNTKDTTWQRKDDVYVYIETDSLGFAKAVDASRQLLPKEGNYIIAEVSWYSKSTQEVNFNLPFNRFYMEETKAKPAEDAYRDAQRDNKPNNTYALVYIKDGEAVLKDVIINEVPIAEFVEE